MLRLVVIALVACGSGGDNTSPGVASGVAASNDAGRVREISGKVIATRGSETRTLATGNTVGAEDVIDTGTDGSVVIELAHNNALWSLESGIKARVDQSVAWGLPAQDAAKPIEHATSSAGRHADRQGADTQVTANESVPRPAGSIVETPPTTTPDPSASPPPPPPPPPDRGGGKDPPKPTQPKTATSPTKPSGGCDEVSCMMNGDAACCAKYRKSGRPAAPKPDAELPESPDRQAIQTAMNLVKPKLRGCVEKAGDVKGTVKVTVKVGGDGRVTSAEVKQSVDPAIDACVVGAIKTLQLPRSRSGLTFSYPIVIN